MSDVAGQVWTALGAAFVASILTTLGSRWVSGFQAKAQTRREGERDLRDDERSLRDKKRERLGEAYVPVLQSAKALQSVAKQLLVVWAEETREGRDERLNKELTEAQKDLDRSIVRLQLEEGTEPSLVLYEQVSSAWIAHRHWLKYSETPQGKGDREAIEGVRKALEDIKSGVGALEEAARNHLATLSRPI